MPKSPTARDHGAGRLRALEIPFRVSVRHNVHEANMAEMGGLEAFVGRLAEESGNDLEYYPAPVSGSEAADGRGKQVGLLRGTNASEIACARKPGASPRAAATIAARTAFGASG